MNDPYVIYPPPEQAPAAPNTAATSTTDVTPVSPPTTNEARHSLSQTAASGLNARSCVTCRRRKVKCDKQVPCSNCKKAQTQCVFPAPGRAPRRPKEGGKPVSEREAMLLKRLRRLEGVVEELSGQVEVEGLRHQSPHSEPSPKDGDSTDGQQNNVRVMGMDEGSRKQWIERSFQLGQGPPKTIFGHGLENSMGSLVLDSGKSKYVANPFWASITEEVDEIRKILDEDDLPTDDESWPAVPTAIVTESSHQSFIMGYSASDVNLKSLHPLPSQIPFYWQTFVENVNPMVKITHIPTMEKVIKAVQSNLDALSPSTEALMFSIYFATITSMNAEEVKLNFGLEKDYLIRQYRFATEQALARAGFLNTSEIVTVQAFVLFLVCVRRHDDTRFVWSLTGLAIRIAQSLGLHRDGTKFGLSPFDTEMRRRLWWQICILDLRASEDHGSEPSIMDQQFDTEFPLSINDSDLDPAAQTYPTPRPGLSEMTFALIRFEICIIARNLTHVPPGQNKATCLSKIQPLSLEDKERVIREAADHLEKTYLKPCDESGSPLHWVAATVARLITAKMTLVIYHPYAQPGKPNTLSQDTRDRLFMASIEIIEFSRLLESESSTKKWGWLFHTYVQWHAIAFILNELAYRDDSIVVGRAWHCLDQVFAGWEQEKHMTKTGMLFRPLRILLVKANIKREQNKAMPKPEKRTLGINNKYLKPPPSGPDLHNDEAKRAQEIARDLFLREFNNFGHGVVNTPVSTNNNNYTGTTSNSNQIDNVRNGFSAQQTPRAWPTPNSLDVSATPDQMLAPSSYLPQTPLTTSWPMPDGTGLDLDMDGLQQDFSWEGWNELVQDAQMEGQAEGNGIGAWW